MIGDVPECTKPLSVAAFSDYLIDSKGLQKWSFFESLFLRQKINGLAAFLSSRKRCPAKGPCKSGANPISFAS
jgi:hypothetical protein